MRVSTLVALVLILSLVKSSMQGTRMITTRNDDADCYVLSLPLSWFDVMQSLSSVKDDDNEMKDALSKALAAIPYEAYFFELPPVNIATREHVQWSVRVTNAPALARIEQDSTAFEEHFRRVAVSSEHNGVVSFMNLGGDAKLVVPIPAPVDIQRSGKHINAAHLGTFVRTSSLKYLRSFWTEVGAGALALSERHKPLWVSTSGLGEPIYSLRGLLIHVTGKMTTSYHNNASVVERN